jgi:O-antigen/teichoic acid export membrane protein
MAIMEAGALGAATISTGRPTSRVARNIAVLAGGQVVTWCLTLVWTLFVPRALGPAGMGELTVAFAVTGVISVVVSLGIDTLMVKEIARDYQKAASLIGTAMLVRAAFVVPSVIAVGLYIYLGNIGTEQALVLWLATGSMVLGLFAAPFLSTFQALERMQYLAYAGILNKAIFAVASVGLVLVGFRVVGVMALALAISAAVLLLNIWWRRDMFGVDWGFRPNQIRFLVVGSLPYWLSGLVLTFYIWIDSVILSVMSPGVVVGWYGVATKVFATLLFVPLLFSTAILPRLSAAFRESVDSMRQAARPAFEIVLVLSLPITAGAALTAQSFIAKVYGSQFEGAGWVLVILTLTLPATYVSTMAWPILIACNRQIAWTKVMIGAAVINPILNLFLIRYFQVQHNNGAIGAALSLLATEIGMALVAFVLIPKILESRSVLRLFRAVAATAGMVLVFGWASRYGLIFEIAASVISFALLALALRLLTVDELVWIRKTAARVVTRS